MLNTTLGTRSARARESAQLSAPQRMRRIAFVGALLVVFVLAGAQIALADVYSLTYTAGEHGSIEGSAAQMVEFEGYGTTLTAVPDDNYHFASWSDDVATAARQDQALATLEVGASVAIDTHTLTYSAGTGGSVDGSATQVVDYNSSGSAVTAAADASHHFVKWSDDSTANPRTDANVIANKSVTAEFAINSAAWKVASVHGDSRFAIEDAGGGLRYFTQPMAQANSWYWFENNGQPANKLATNALASGPSNHPDGINTLPVRAGARTFAVSNVAAGQKLGDLKLVVEYDKTLSLMNPAAGYPTINFWITDGAGNYAIFAPASGGIAAVSVTTELDATWRRLTFDLTRSDIASGALCAIYENNVPPTGNPFAIKRWDNIKNLTIAGCYDYQRSPTGGWGAWGTMFAPMDYVGNPTLNNGYGLGLIWGDTIGNPPYNTEQRRIRNVTVSFGGKSYAGAFEAAQAGHTLAYAAGAGGSIDGSATQVVVAGSSGTAVTAMPATGYHFVSWSDAVSTAARTDASVIADKSVTANFAIDTFTLAYTAGTGGSVDGSATQVVDYNTSGTLVTAMPATGYHFVKWSDDVMTAARTDANVTADKSVTASFAINTYALTYTAGTHGTITGVKSQTVNWGTDGSEVVAVPDPGYHWVGWSDSVSTLARTDTNVKADVTVTALFVNNAPVATPGTVTMDANGIVTITLAGTDADYDPLTYQWVSGPSHGTLGPVLANKVTYRPTTNFGGADSFTFRAYDGTAYSAPATVSITVSAPKRKYGRP